MKTTDHVNKGTPTSQARDV